jgi:hypothetical protein
MDEPFDLLVTYKGQEIYFEPDEECNYRAMINPEGIAVMVRKTETVSS